MLEFEAPKGRHSARCKFVGQLFVCSTSRYVKAYWLDQSNPWKKVPASIESFYVEVGVPDPALEYKTYFDGAEEYETVKKLLKGKVCSPLPHPRSREEKW
jgi:hypothetical protein